MNKADSDGRPQIIIADDNLHIEKELCPECGAELVYNGRCTTCMECGWSACEVF